MSEKQEENQRLLIVDDSKVIRVTARKILRDHFETFEAVDGENAWEILTTEAPFSLIVSDLTMPNLDGFGLLARIRNSHLPHVRDLPVIIITGANETETTMKQARQVGATDFIGKPFDAIHLLARTQAHARSHTVTTALQQENTSLEDQSASDSLTGLASETAFMERGYQQLSYAIRNSSSLGIFRIEIDEYGRLFKEYGAQFSETVVCALANTLSMVIRQEDTAARIGTARFSLLLPGMNNIGVRNLAERINDEFGSRFFKAGDTRVTVTASIGVGLPDIRKDMRFDELLSMADRRLLQASKLGGNRIIFDDETPATETASVAETADGISAAAELEPGRPEQSRRAVFPFDVESLEVEEIELFAPGYPFDIFKSQHKPNVTECRSPDMPEPAAGTFAGPVPDNVIEITPVADPATESATRLKTSGKPTQVYTADLADSVESTLDAALSMHPEQDDIVISAPFAAHLESHPGATTAFDEKPEAHKAGERSASIETDTDLTHGEGRGSSDTAETDTRRPGFLKRIFTLFRRKRSLE
jgi:diguanylate cyclase (GGDEF)-like protein